MAKEDIKRIDFETYLCNSDEEPIEKYEDVSVLFNQKIISIKKVEKMINDGSYKKCDKIIVTTPKQADILKGVLNDEQLNMYEYRVYYSNEVNSDYYTIGYVFATNENKAKEYVQKEFPNDYITIELVTNIKNGNLIMGQRLD